MPAVVYLPLALAGSLPSFYGGAPSAALCALAAGAALWTLCEYALHRFVFHALDFVVGTTVPAWALLLCFLAREGERMRSPPRAQTLLRGRLPLYHTPPISSPAQTAYTISL